MNPGALSAVSVARIGSVDAVHFAKVLVNQPYSDASSLRLDPAANVQGGVAWSDDFQKC
jgi:hypothetical protein